MGALLSVHSKISPGSRKTFLSLTKLQLVPFLISLICEIAKFSLTASQQEIPDMLECLMAAMAALLMVSAIYILVKDVYLRKDELLAPPTPDWLSPTTEPEAGSSVIWKLWRQMSSHYSSELGEDEESLSDQFGNLSL